MNKNDLIASVASSAGLSKSDATRAIESLLDAVTNSLNIDEKVSIVTDRVQTTRNLIRAIYTSNEGQLVFLDTPGIHKAEGNLGRNMNKVARSSLDGVDIALIIFDVSSTPNQLDEGWFRRICKSEIECIFILNKSCNLFEPNAVALSIVCAGTCLIPVFVNLIIGGIP